MSPNYFSECFHKELGFSFQNYLQEPRLKFAGKLLIVFDLPVTEISYAAGYNTPSFRKGIQAEVRLVAKGITESEQIGRRFRQKMNTKAK